MTADFTQTVARLGWAGLLPFVAAPVGVCLFETHVDLLGEAIAAYGLAILCFLAGAWWGIALLRRRAAILVASNSVVIAAWAGHVLLDRPASLLLLAGLFIVMVLIERLHSMFQPQPAYYAVLRLRLSCVAALSLVLSALLLQ